MKLAENENILAQNKAVILYIFNKANKQLSSDELLSLVLSITNMNYFYFKQFILDLLDMKYIINYEKDNISLYEITKEGKKVLELTENIIPGITKQEIDSKFKEKLLEVKEAFSVTAEFNINENNEYSVSCKALENGKNLFELNMLVGSVEQAKKITENWKKQSNFLYQQIFYLMVNNINTELHEEK